MAKTSAVDCAGITVLIALPLVTSFVDVVGRPGLFARHTCPELFYSGDRLRYNAKLMDAKEIVIQIVKAMLERSGL